MSNKPQIFGLLVTKNESPILRDILDINTQYIKKIYVLDGGDDNAESIFKQYPEVVYYIHEKELESRLGKKIAPVDGIRGYLFDEIMKTASEGDWITLMHGDEMFYHNPTEVIMYAEKLDVNIVGWYAPHFFPHKNDYHNWTTLQNKPVYDRFKYYAHYGNKCWIEHRQFKIDSSMKYDYKAHGKIFPTSIKPYKQLEAFPIYFHYKVWNLDKRSYKTELFNFKYKRTVIHPKDKWSTVHYYPLTFKDFFRESYPDYSSVGYFDGSFGDLENSYNALRDRCGKQMF